jgi:hypothetical protein
MHLATQFSIPLANRQDALAQVLGELGRGGTNISAIMLTVPLEQNVLRVVFDQPERARQVLSKIGAPCGETQVICANFGSAPGALAAVVAILAEAQVKIEYAYCGPGKKPGQTVAVLRVRNIRRAMGVLSPELTGQASVA